MEKSYRLTDSEAATVLTLIEKNVEEFTALAAAPIDTESVKSFQEAADRYKAIYNKIEKEFLNR